MGYRYGLRQPAQAIKLKIAFPLTADLPALDAWMEKCFAVQMQPYLGMEVDPNTEARNVAEIAWRILLLGAALLRAGRIPAFDAGRVLALQQGEQQSGVWALLLAVPQVDYLPFRLVSATYDTARKLVLNKVRDIDAHADMENLYQLLETQLLKPLQAASAGGYSTIRVLQGAYDKDIPFFHLGSGVYQLGWGKKLRRIHRSGVEADSTIGATTAQHKYWAAQWLRKAGLPAPVHALVSTEEEACRAARRLEWPLVVKPVNRDRGEGVTVAVGNEEELRKAFQKAAALSQKILVERTIPGICHRILVVNGTVLYAIKRRPKLVTGDGRSTVAELIAQANELRLAKPAWARTTLFPADELAIATLRDAGLTLDSIPAEGQVVFLRIIESTEWGGDSEDFSDSIHPENIEISKQAAQLFGLVVAGVDIITPDIARPWYENGAVINEVNSAPLMGSGPISINAMPKFLENLVHGNGRIPIEVIVGGDAALEMARIRQQALVEKGDACYVTSHIITLNPDGNPMPMPVQGLYRRCQALLMNKNIDVIILVIQTDELLATGFPVDRIVRLDSAPGEILAASESGAATLSNRRDAMMGVLQRLLP